MGLTVANWGGKEGVPGPGTTLAQFAEPDGRSRPMVQSTLDHWQSPPRQRGRRVYHLQFANFRRSRLLLLSSRLGGVAKAVYYPISVCGYEPNGSPAEIWRAALLGAHPREFLDDAQDSCRFHPDV